MANAQSDTKEEQHGPRDVLKPDCECTECAQKRQTRERRMQAPDIETLLGLNRASLERKINSSLEHIVDTYKRRKGLIKPLLRLHDFGIFTTHSRPTEEPQRRSNEYSKTMVEDRQVAYLDFKIARQDIHGNPYQGIERFCESLLQDSNLFATIAYPQYNARDCTQWHEALECYRHESSFPDNGGWICETRKASSKELLASASWQRQASLREHPDMMSGAEDMPTWFIKCLPIFVFCTAAKWDMNFSVARTILASAQEHLTPSFQEVEEKPAQHGEDCACVDCAKQRADLKTWASVPLHDIGTFFKLNMDFLHGELSCTPQNHVPLDDESLEIVPDLCRLNELGLMTTMSSSFRTDCCYSKHDGLFYASTQRPWLEFMIPQGGKGLPTRAKIEKLASLLLTHPKILATVIFPRYEEGLEPAKTEESPWGDMLAYASHTCEHRSSLSGPHPTGRRTTAPDRESLVKGTVEWEECGKIDCQRPASIWVAKQMSEGFPEHWRPIFFYMIARYWEDESNLYFYDNIRKLAIDAGFKILFPDPRLPKEEPDKPLKSQKTSKSRKTTVARVTKPEQTKRVLRSTKKGQ
ncbi:hypothetical protein AC578_10502 [Pseudocercospora eumusae]|uniref:Uncharacterized protein n=1 Tax=Pseudocercospora eumusae TaxID=321146 RepID=A0A139H8I4_9PEZI|nr:hypothetical protein AC578_10502 [Pseudocercospora eumusae]